MHPKFEHTVCDFNTCIQVVQTSHFSYFFLLENMIDKGTETTSNWFYVINLKIVHTLLTPTVSNFIHTLLRTS